MTTNQRGLARFALMILTMAIPALAQHNNSITWAPSVVDSTHDAPTTYNLKRSSVTGDCSKSPVGPTCVLVTSVPASLNGAIDGSSVLVTGAKFFYVVTASNAGGESPASNEVALTTPSFPPGQPGTASGVAK